MKSFARIVGSAVRRGFTLVEVLFVFVILGILFVMTFFMFSPGKSDGVAQIWDRSESVARDIKVGDIIRVSVDTPTSVTVLYYEVTTIVENKDQADKAIGGDKVTLKDKDGMTVSYRDDVLLNMSSNKWNMKVILPTAPEYDGIKAGFPAD
jgi:prepilin-type N-terminal cleavage/methylation domain-containing protein